MLFTKCLVNEKLLQNAVFDTKDLYPELCGWQGFISFKCGIGESYWMSFHVCKSGRFIQITCLDRGYRCASTCTTYCDPRLSPCNTPKGRMVIAGHPWTICNTNMWKTRMWKPIASTSWLREDTVRLVNVNLLFQTTWRTNARVWKAVCWSIYQATCL